LVAQLHDQCIPVGPRVWSAAVEAKLLRLVRGESLVRSKETCLALRAGLNDGSAALAAELLALAPSATAELKQPVAVMATHADAGREPLYSLTPLPDFGSTRADGPSLLPGVASAGRPDMDGELPRNTSPLLMDCLLGSLSEADQEEASRCCAPSSSLLFW
jgi:hypothetical protein